MALNIINDFNRIGQLIRLNNSRAAISTLTQSVSVGENSLSTFLNSNVRPEGNLFVSNEAFNNVQRNLTTITSTEESLFQLETLVERARELGIQSSDTELGSDERNEINKELETIKAEINRIARTIEFEGVQLFEPDGTGIIGLGSVNFTSAENSKEALAAIEEFLGQVHSSESLVSAFSTQFNGAASILGNPSGLVVSSFFFVENQNLETIFNGANRIHTVQELEELFSTGSNNFESELIGSILNLKI